MSNDPLSNDQEMDSVALNEGVERTAEGKNEPPEVIIDRMISSDWILEELMGTASDPSLDSNDNGDEDDSLPQKQADGSDDEIDTEELAELIKGIKSRQPTAGAESKANQPLTETEQERESSGADRAPDVSVGTPVELLTVVLDMRDRIDELSEELNELRAEHEATADQLDPELEGTVADLETTVAGAPTHSDLDVLVDAIDEELTEFKTSIRQIDGRIAQIQESQTESARSRKNLKQSHSELEQRIEREFDSIEAVLRNVLDTSDDLDYRIGSLADSHQSDVEPLQEYRKDQQRLVELKQEAQQKGISQAVCSYCDEETDLGLLEEPYCHNCRHLLTGITEAGWLPFRKAELQTNSTQKGLADSTKEEFDDNAPGDLPRVRDTGR